MMTERTTTCPLGLVTSGGTIAMTTGDDGVRRPGSSADVAALVRRMAGVDIAVSSAGDMDSSQATPHMWATILAVIVDAVHSNPRAPVIVTHGTDTLAWSAGMAQAAGPWPVPIVFVGAMTPAGEDGSDAEGNIAAALAVATQAGPGVWAVHTHGGQADVFQGGFFRKAHLSNGVFHGVPSRFGTVTDGALVQELAPEIVSVSLPDRRFSVPVLYLQAHPAVSTVLCDIDVERAVFESVVLGLYPSMTCPATMIGFAQRCLNRSIPVLACGDSPVDDAAIYESAVLLQDVGVHVNLGATPELLLPAACGRFQ